jgi:hypothetical protein
MMEPRSPVYSGNMSESMSPAQNPLSAKLSQVLGTSYTDYSVKSALESLDPHFSENTPASRRQLRAALELLDIQSSGKLLEQYERLIDVVSLSFLMLLNLAEFEQPKIVHRRHSGYLQNNALPLYGRISPNIAIFSRCRSFAVST